MARSTLIFTLLVVGLAAGQDGAAIANDPELFSERFRVEFVEMNDIFAEFGFELEVIEGERPSLAAITEEYGDPDRDDDVEVTLGYGDTERRATLRFYYYRDIGFGVLPSDPEPLVMVVKRRAD